MSDTVEQQAITAFEDNAKDLIYLIGSEHNLTIKEACEHVKSILNKVIADY